MRQCTVCGNEDREKLIALSCMGSHSKVFENFHIASIPYRFTSTIVDGGYYNYYTHTGTLSHKMILQFWLKRPRTMWLKSVPFHSQILKKITQDLCMRDIPCHIHFLWSYTHPFSPHFVGFATERNSRSLSWPNLDGHWDRMVAATCCLSVACCVRRPIHLYTSLHKKATCRLLMYF